MQPIFLARRRVLLEDWVELPESVKDAVRALVLRSPGEAEWRWSGAASARVGRLCAERPGI